MLSLQAAAQGLAISRLALYDAPYLVDTRGVDRSRALAELIAADRRGEAVEYFQRELVGIPAEVVAQLRHAPFRPGMERIAHTLVYEATIVGDRALPPAAIAARVTPPTLAIAGGAGSPIMPRAAHALEQLLPNAAAHILPEQGHDLEPAALGPVLATFFEAAR
jgi:pimeloyl-ACP methyl ester carboxylesterase